MYFDTSLKTSRVDWSTLSSPRRLHGGDCFFPKGIFERKRGEFALEEEKEQDTAEKAVEELKRQLQPKRDRVLDDTGDAHEMLAEVDNWGLSVHRREATRVQNRRNVQVGSLENQPKPHTYKDGFLCHSRLGLVGWISY